MLLSGSANRKLPPVNSEFKYKTELTERMEEEEEEEEEEKEVSKAHI